MHLFPIAAAAALLLLPFGSVSGAEPREEIATLIEVPGGNGPFPVVIYANGFGTSARGDLPTAVAKAIVERGMAVVRFDWSFQADRKGGAGPKDLVSPDLAQEIADYQAVLASARRDGRFRSDSIILMGKSLGSMVTARVLTSQPDIVGAVLLTPVCSRTSQPTDPDWLRYPYPHLSTESRPIAFVAGDADPLCDVKMLYGLAGTMRAPARVSIVDGDHGFLVADRPDITEENLRAAGDAAAAAAVSIFRRNGRK